MEGTIPFIRTGETVTPFFPGICRLFNLKKSQITLISSLPLKIIGKIMVHYKLFLEQEQMGYINGKDLYFRLRTSGSELFI